MSLKSPAFPASVIFDELADTLSTDKSGNAAGIYAITLKSGGDTATWHIDLKAGIVGRGEKPDGIEKPDVILILSDTDFAKLVAGEANAQRLFMSGKLKIRGDVMKATRVEPIFKRIQHRVKAKL